MSWVKISSTKVKKSWSVNSFCIIPDKMGPKNFASLYAGVPTAGRIGMNGCNLFLRGLYSLADP